MLLLFQMVGSPVALDVTFPSLCLLGLPALSSTVSWGGPDAALVWINS